MLCCFKKAHRAVAWLLRAEWEERATEINRRWFPIHERFTWKNRAALNLCVCTVTT